MKRSTDRILTTHTGSLPRPQAADRSRAGAGARAARSTPPCSRREVAKAVDAVVAQQVACGVDVVSDGEMSKPSYATYIKHRVDGIAARPARRRERARHHDRARPAGASGFRRAAAQQFQRHAVSGCVGPLRYKDESALEARPRQPEGRDGQVEADRDLHDGGVARHPDALHHQPALQDRGRIRGGARRT